MGSIQSCLSSFRALTWLQTSPQLVNLESEEPKVYSWDKKPTNNAGDFLVENQTDQNITKKEIKGNQFMIRNCTNCVISLLDHSNTVTIDDCKNCKIFVGPTKVRRRFYSTKKMHKIIYRT